MDDNTHYMLLYSACNAFSGVARAMEEGGAKASFSNIETTLRYRDVHVRIYIDNEMLGMTVGAAKIHLVQRYLGHLVRENLGSLRLLLKFPPRHPGEEYYVKKLSDHECFGKYRFDFNRILGVILA